MAGTAAGVPPDPSGEAMWTSATLWMQLLWEELIEALIEVLSGNVVQ
jgi:hypothetical protein